MPAPRTYLITGARAPATLEVIRRLGRAGHRIIAADSVRAPVGRFSKYVHQFFRVPGPRVDPAGFIGALRDIMEKEKVDRLLPTCEEIFYVSRHRDALAGLGQVCCAGFAVLEQLHHKGKFARLTREIDSPVTTPESVLVTNETQLRGFEQESTAWVFKPVYSRFAARTLIRPTPDGLKTLTVDAANPWLAQRYVAGRELSSFSIAIDGYLTAHTLYHSRHRAGQAAGIYFAPEQNPIVFGFVERLVAHLGFSGQIGFDFIICAETARVYVLECNPRLTSGIHLLPAELDLDGALCFKARTTGSSRIDCKSRMLAAAMWSHGLWHAMRNKSLAKWRHDLARAGDVVFAHDDILPALGQFYCLAETGWLSLLHRRGMIATTTADIEWNG